MDNCGFVCFQMIGQKKKGTAMSSQEDRPNTEKETAMRSEEDRPNSK